MAVDKSKIRISMLHEGLGLSAAESTAALAAAGQPSEKECAAFARYLASDRKPFFAPGYSAFKERLVLDALGSDRTRRVFLDDGELPDGYGARIDERIVEYPWAFLRLPEDGVIVDAGSTFNKSVFLKSALLRDRKIVIYTLATDRIELNPLVSYLFGDLRDIFIKDDSVAGIACISTLEHVGFTYEYRLYSKRNPWPQSEPSSYLDAISEFKRILKPGGRLLLTVPYGRYEDHGWLQQFDRDMIDRVKTKFGGKTISEAYFRYATGGWRIARANECDTLSYFNIHETGEFEEDGLAAARAVCCLELAKIG